jgi:hypothetical protein
MFVKLNTIKFFGLVSNALGKKITPLQMKTAYLLLKEIDEAGITDRNQVAYILGTCWHECHWKSIKERRDKPGTQVWRWQQRYWPSGYYGRGLPQLTWRKNYKKFSPIVGYDLVKDPDKVLLVEVGAKILVFGMMNGTFTSNGLYSQTRLSKFFPECGEPDWIGARAIVNGSFMAEQVASASLKILQVIVASHDMLT